MQISEAELGRVRRVGLVVDAEPQLRSELSGALREAQFSVITAAEDREGVRALQEGLVPDAAVVHGGFRLLLSVLRQDDRFQRTRLVVLGEEGGKRSPREHHLRRGLSLRPLATWICAHLGVHGKGYALKLDDQARAQADLLDHATHEQLLHELHELVRQPRPTHALWLGPNRYRAAIGEHWIDYEVDDDERQVRLIAVGP